MPPSARCSRKLILLGGALAAALAGMLLSFARADQGPARLPMHDFVEYWAAGRLIAAGENPYDPRRMHELEREAGRTEEGILMWNPPWVLPLVAPLGMLPVHTAHLLWLLFHLGVIAWCADRLWRLYGGNETWRITAVLLAFSFLPTYFSLLAGQISPLLLVGATAFLTLLRRKRDFAAGAVTVLLAIKPHLVYLFWLALLLWALKERRWRVLAGGAVAGLVLTAAAAALDPDVLGQYWHTFTQQPPAQYRSPTLGTLLRLAVGEGSFRWQFLAMAPGLVWFAFHYQRRRTWEWDREMPLLLLVGVLTTAYGGWPFDLVLLLLPVVALAADLSRQGSRLRCAAAGAIYCAINAVALFQLTREVEYLGFIWMTPALLLGYVGLRRTWRDVSHLPDRSIENQSPQVAYLSR